MADYENLDSMIGPLKRAAIDAYMCSDNWGGLAGFKISGNKYVYNHPAIGEGSMFGTPTEEVDRPDENGEGGGDWKMRVPMAPDSEEAGKYADEFAAVRSHIDEALHRWTYLPEPTDIAELVETLRQANRTIAMEAVSDAGVVTGGGEIGGNINLAMENSDAMAGGMMTAFKADFMSQLGKAIGGQHALTIILGGCVAAEERIWIGARQTVADLVQDATDSFNAAAEGGGVKWDVVLKVAGYAAAGAAIFASGGAATAVAVGALGLTILTDSVPSEEEGAATEAPENNYDSIAEHFASTLEDLDTAITQEEQELETNMGDNLATVRADQSSYDLARPPVVDVEDGDDLRWNAEQQRNEEIFVDDVLAYEITGTYLPNVEAELGVAAGFISDANSRISLLRDSSIGLGQWGPGENYYELRHLLYELLKNLQVEIIYSADALDLAMRDFKRQDEATQTALDEHAATIDLVKVSEPGGTYDPWN